MEPKAQTRLLQSRSQPVVRNSDVTVEITELINIPLTSNSNEIDNRKLSKIPKFEPLDEDGERYLQEHMQLPPIDLTSAPTRYYINPHPTESVMSSGVNSANEWWDRVDYDLEDEGGLCCVDGTVQRWVPRGRRGLTEETSRTPEETPGLKTFPRTLEKQQERKIKELREGEARRAEIISRLEKQMVSLSNLKRQYKKTVARTGCVMQQAPSAAATDDKLARQRDSLLFRLKRKKLEDELKRKKQIERRMEIIQTLLSEQRQKEKDVSRMIKGIKERRDQKQNKAKEESRGIAELEKTSLRTDSIEKVIQIEEVTVDSATLVQDEIAIQVDGNPPSPETVVGMPSPTESPRKTSKNKGRRKKSSEVSSKQEGGKKKDKKKKSAKVSEEAPAICEAEPEPPAGSQMAELSLWFENWRETISQQCNRDEQSLPEEKEVALKPLKIVFENVRGGRKMQLMTSVTNMGQGALQCRVHHVHQPPSAYVQAELVGPSKARTGQSWTLAVTLDPLEGVQDEVTEVTLLFCRGEMRTLLSVVVEVLTPRARPALSNSVIRFGPQMYWAPAVTKHLQVTNVGTESCVLRWHEVVQRHSPVSGGESISWEDLRCGNSDGNCFGSEESREVAIDMLKMALRNAFRTFQIATRQPLLLPPKSKTSLAIKFLPAMTLDRGDVFANFRFHFEGGNVETEFQDLAVTGRIDKSPFKLEFEVINLKLCYAGGTVQQAKIVVRSSARHACHVTSRVPRSMAGVVTVLPRSTVMAAMSYVTLTVRLVLGWDFLEKPCRYLDLACGLLMFPIMVWVTDPGLPGAPPLEATVIASVAPPCPLTVTPPQLDIGTVTTMETVEAALQLRNHFPRPFRYAFVNLPPSVMIEPGGATGSILPMETVKLKLLYSPRARDLGVECERPGGEGEVNFILKCFTTVSFASPVQKKDVQEEFQGTKHFSQYTESSQSCFPSKEVSFSRSINKVSVEHAKHDEKERKVKFQEGFEKSSEDSIVYLRMNTGGGDEGDDMEEEKELENEYLIISEVKEEDERGTEDLWDFYSNFQFEKCSKIDKKERQKRKSIEENEEEKVDGVSNESGNSEDNVSRKSEIDTQEKSSKEERDINENFNLSNENSDTNESFSLLEADFLEESDSNCSESEKEESSENDGEDICLLPASSQRFASLSVKAYIVDPLVELSAQAVVLPPTPCTGYRIAHVYLRSRPQKHCSLHEMIRIYKVRFEIRSPKKYLAVEPSQGYVSYKQNQKVSLFYSPVLNEKDISDKALQMKIESLKWKKIQEMLDVYNNSKAKVKDKDKKRKQSSEEVNQMEKQEANVNANSAGKVKKSKASAASTKSNDIEIKKGKGKKSKASAASTKSNDIENKKGKGKKSKSSVASVKGKKNRETLKSSKLRKKSSGPLPDVVIDPNDVEVTEEDLKEAEMNMLKYFEPYEETITLLCLLETEMENGNRRRETLSCDVLCSVVSPSIFLRSSPCLDFGPVALGTSSRMEAIITNISFFDALVSLSTLNPHGPFYCPAHLEYPYWKGGELELPPEHILTVPINFKPVDTNEAVEAFEVVSGSTTIHMQARGRGVLPSFSFQPDQEVFSITSAPGKRTDLTVSITNSCEAPLVFRICLDYVREGQSLPPPPEEQKSPEVKKKDAKKEKKAKGMPEFTVLTDELNKCLENEFITFENTENEESVFKLVSNSGNVTVLNGETQQVVFRFTPPVAKVEGNPIKSPGRSRTSSPVDGKKSKHTSFKDKLNVDTNNKKDGKNKLISESARGKKKGSDSVKSERKVETKKQIYAARFSVILGNTKKVKDWLVLGTKK